MDNLTSFKLQIFKYALIIAVVFGVGSLPFLGFSIPYLYGLALGTCVAFAGFSILVFVSQRVILRGKAWLAPLGYFLRLPMYGLAFCLSYMGYGLTAGVACIFGLLTIQVAIIYVHGIKAKLSKGKKENNIDKEGE